MVSVSKDSALKVTPRQQALKIALVLLTTLCAVGLVVLFAPERAVAPITATLFFVAVMALVVGTLGYLSARAAAGKRQREIDAETAYVQGQSVQRKARTQESRIVSLDEVLNRRTQEIQVG